MWILPWEYVTAPARCRRKIGRVISTVPYLANQPFHERRNIFFSRPLRFCRHTRSTTLGRASDLPPLNLAGLLPFFFRDMFLGTVVKPITLVRLAHQQRPRAVLRFNRLDGP